MQRCAPVVGYDIRGRRCWPNARARLRPRRTKIAMHSRVCAPIYSGAIGGQMRARRPHVVGAITQRNKKNYERESWSSSSSSSSQLLLLLLPRFWCAVWFAVIQRGLISKKHEWCSNRLYRWAHGPARACRLFCVPFEQMSAQARGRGPGDGVPHINYNLY